MLYRLLIVLFVLGCDDPSVSDPADSGGDGGADVTVDARLGLDGADQDAGGDAPDIGDAAADVLPDGLAALTGADPSIYLGVWAGDADDVWMVGGQPGASGGRIVHFDGAQLSESATPGGPTLWWVWGRYGDVWADNPGPAAAESSTSMAHS